MSTQPLNIISRYGEDDISLWTVNVEFEDYKRVAGNAVQLKVELSRYLHRGSPPHTRGKDKNVRYRRFLRGITPAHAGKSASFACLAASPRDHPRTRGEKTAFYQSVLCPVGSPPHTRGKGSAPAAGSGSDGITPAHAGKRRTVYFKHVLLRDHPRTRGEKEVFAEKYPEGEGSPPHTRGKGSVRGFRLWC